MIVTKFKPEDLLRVATEAEARMAIDAARPAAEYPSWSIWGREDECVACGGVIPIWIGRATLWAFFSPAARPYMATITRFCRRIINECPVNRLECTVRCDNDAANRWALLLGLELEAPLLRAYDPQGQDMALYARVRA